MVTLPTLHGAQAALCVSYSSCGFTHTVVSKVCKGEATACSQKAVTKELIQLAPAIAAPSHTQHPHCTTIRCLVCVTRRKLQTPGTAKEHKRPGTPTINTNDRQSAKLCVVVRLSPPVLRIGLRWLGGSGDRACYRYPIIWLCWVCIMMAGGRCA